MTDKTPAREACRHWVDDKHNYCFEPAVVIVWGKLHPRDELGPRCEDHLPKELLRYWPGNLSQYAAFDLRGLYRD